ncbi:hypothetical protein GGTG_01713 [Gaeumannomyces tritici R3-111a-1]|uniref:Uncharacterized protein n=1 Tax=Gaeumannomyces tritici (strain R3-111a-1) TaxID=644352 RepID=J3NKD4_GAET3|nr:hypothetical protein GGTG_01713 [Gaeumannomyces tritici R3-111a-1]EJT81738.1 hypothetical protein GGTG_01713 [Gaeumannomyces tritici R3-111a-1]
MHTPSFIHIAVTGLAAASAVSSFSLGAPSGVVSRHVGALVALAAPALAFPIAETPSELVARQPHHQGKRTKAKGNGPAAKAKGVKRDLAEDHEEDEEHDLETREPHHQGKRTKAKAKGAKRDLAEDHEEDEEHDLETREPHHQGKRTKAKAKGAKRDLTEENHDEDETELETREPHHQGKRTKAKGKN